MLYTNSQQFNGVLMTTDIMTCPVRVSCYCSITVATDCGQLLI